MKGRAIPYSETELHWIKERCEDTRRVLHAAFCRRFKRTDVSLDDIKSLCTRKGWNTGRTGRFERGGTPANKGKKCPPNKGGNHPNARRTQFKKGTLPANTKYLGHERVSKDGYVEISIAQKNPHTGYDRRYVLKHRHLWEQKNGAVPKGKCLKCLDGNKLNTDPSNWEAIDRGVLPLLSGRWGGLPYDDAPTELKASILALAKLKHASRERKKAA